MPLNRGLEAFWVERVIYIYRSDIMHKDEVAALNRDFDYVLAKLADLEARVAELEGRSSNLTAAAGVSNSRVPSK